MIAPDDPAPGRILGLVLPFLLKRCPSFLGLCEGAGTARSTAAVLLPTADEKSDEPEDARQQVKPDLATLDTTCSVYSGNEAAIRTIPLPRRPVGKSAA